MQHVFDREGKAGGRKEKSQGLVLMILEKILLSKSTLFYMHGGYNVKKVSEQKGIHKEVGNLRHYVW